MKQFKITIPKPCHEDWSQMKPKEKGRFCSSCSKTVVDFTKKTTKEIQEYLVENSGNRVCGHFYRKQLDSIVIQIPEETFQQSLSFQKLFILALLLVMGTTLFSCKTDNGKVQKVNKVELIDTVVKTEKVVDSLEVNKHSFKLPRLKCKTNQVLDGEVVIMGAFEDNIEITEEGEIILEEIQILSFYKVDIPPRFKGTKKDSREILNEEFNKRMNDFVVKNFDYTLFDSLGLTQGKKRIYSQFVIDSIGSILEIKTRAPHQKLKKHTEEILQKLAQFIPAQKDGKNVSVRYTLPIIFVVE